MKILISGGSGLVGSAIANKFSKQQHDIHILTRSITSHSVHGQIYWNPSKKEINSSELEGFDVVIHLAGAGIANKRWTDARKEVIVKSRTASATFLIETISHLKAPPKHFVSASAVGYYGSSLSPECKYESDSAGNDFLSECCIAWEESVKPIEQLGIPLTIIRTGVVLSEKGGALPQMAKPFKFYLGSAIGTGKQFIPWIHMDDLVGIFMHCIESKFYGIYNGVAPNPVNNKDLTKSIAQQFNNALWLPNVPSWLLKLILGERAMLVLLGQNVSSKKVEESGFQFKFETIDKAMEDIKNKGL